MGIFLLIFGVALLVPFLGNHLTIALSTSASSRNPILRHALHTHLKGRNYVYGEGMLLSRLGSMKKETERNLLENVDHSNNRHDDIEDAHRKAQESDEDWYAMIMSDILGVEESKDDTKKESGEVESSFVEREADDTVGFDQGINPFLAGPNKVHLTSSNSTSQGASDTIPSMMRKNSSRADEERYCIDDSSEENCDDGAFPLSLPQNKNRAPWAANDGMNQEGIVVLRYVDQRGLQKTIEVDVLMDLGYRLSDIQKLRGIAIDKIVKSGFQKPKGGVPKNWTVLSSSPEVEVDFIRKSAKMKRESQDGSKCSRSQSPSNEARDLPGSGERIEIDIRKRRKMSVSKQGSSDSSSSRTNDNFWMDVGTFTSYLRKEAQLRLSILGPSWSDAVKDESRWRLKIYKNWLAIMINEPKRGKPMRSKRRGRPRRATTTEVEGVRTKKRQRIRARHE